jgi:hypothetical protein
MINGQAVMTLRQNGPGIANPFYLNPFVLKMESEGTDVSEAELQDVLGGPQPDLLRILHPGGLLAVFPLLPDNSHDLRWRFLRYLWEKLLPKKNLRDWPPALRLFFAPWNDADENFEPKSFSPEPFFVLDLLGGTFTITGHGTGKPTYDWIPPADMSSNLNWIATRFYRRWKRQADDGSQHHLHWETQRQNGSNELAQMAPCGVQIAGTYRRPVSDEVNTLPDLLARSNHQIAKIICAEVQTLGEPWLKYHSRNGYFRDGHIQERDLLEALATEALPKSTVRVDFPPGAEEFRSSFYFDLRDSRYYGATLWGNDLLLGIEQLPGEDVANLPRASRFLDAEAPREGGWWHTWATWLSTKPHDICFPRTSALLRLDDPTTPLGIGRLGGGDSSKEDNLNPKPVRSGREPVFWS